MRASSGDEKFPNLRYGMNQAVGCQPGQVRRACTYVPQRGPTFDDVCDLCMRAWA